VAIKKIDRIINNSISLNQKMEQDGEFYDPVEFWNQVDQVKNAKKGLELEIQELRLAEKELESKSSPNLQPKEVVTVVKTSAPESKPVDAEIISLQSG
jgi:hypothetical protein